MRTVMLLVVAVGGLAVSVPAALATTASHTGDDGITVIVSLSDTATAGEPFTVSESIENTTNRARLVRVTPTLQGPD